MLEKVIKIEKSSSVLDTKKIAGEFAKTLKTNEVIFLDGDLGSGKTTFVQGILEYFGFSEPVRSPTFTLLNTYEISDHPFLKRIYHADFYRLNDPSEILMLGFDEILEDAHSVLFIEWPQKGISTDFLIQPTKLIKWNYLSEFEREISFYESH